MAIIDYAALADDIRDAAHPLRGTQDDRYDPLIDLVGDASVVLLGEATHGTHEFYRMRAEITQRLIREKGFNAIAVEADWPDAYRVNRYVRAMSNDQSAAEALGDFSRFPMWMWRNADIVDLVDWLHAHNSERPQSQRVGLYGLDLYSLYGSIAAVVDYLDRVDPKAAEQARRRYSCLDHVGEEAQRYGYGVYFGERPSCEDQAVDQLLDLRRRRGDLVSHDGLLAEDEQFAAEQNARVVQNAERYYRNMFGRDENTWNLRDQHMSDTLDSLRNHIARQGRTPKIVVWEHNSHIGDASATEMSRRGEHNVGQLARRRYGDDCRLIGFTTYSGSVTCASDWDAPAERKRVRPGMQGSVEAIMHATGLREFFLPLRDHPIAEQLREPLLERAIGVIYLPQSERASHYFYCRLADQFDGLIHVDQTRALDPLDRTSQWERGEPDTYPFGV
jgi:erythromycin esterase-like protein